MLWALGRFLSFVAMLLGAGQLLRAWWEGRHLVAGQCMVYNHTVERSWCWQGGRSLSRYPCFRAGWSGRFYPAATNSLPLWERQAIASPYETWQGRTMSQVVDDLTSDTTMDGYAGQRTMVSAEKWLEANYPLQSKHPCWYGVSTVRFQLADFWENAILMVGGWISWYLLRAREAAIII